MPPLSGGQHLPLHEQAVNSSSLRKIDSEIHYTINNADNFIGRKAILNNLKQLFETHHVIVVVGMCGSGKTRLAHQYARENRSYYSNIDLIQKSTFDEYYSALKNMKYEQNNSSLPHLIILDGLNDPNISYSARDQLSKERAHILITSQMISKFNNIFNVIKLEMWSSQEAHDYLKQVEGNKEQLNSLAEALNRLPLALAHAVSHIKEVGFNVDKYLNELNTDCIQLLKQRPQAIMEYPKTVAETLEITIQMLINHGPEGELASKILKFCTFLGKDPIPYEFIIKCISLDKSIKTLKKPPILDDFESRIKSGLGTLINYSVLIVLGNLRYNSNLLFKKLAEYNLMKDPYKKNYYDVVAQSLMILLGEIQDSLESNQDLMQIYLSHIEYIINKKEWPRLSSIKQSRLYLYQARGYCFQKKYQQSLHKILESRQLVTDSKSKEEKNLFNEINIELEKINQYVQSSQDLNQQIIEDNQEDSELFINTRNFIDNKKKKPTLEGQTSAQPIIVSSGQGAFNRFKGFWKHKKN
ncbi:MAG: hypothetical protein QRY71_04320 [Candidatus Rhabdochlamydia sp.]